MYDTSTRLTPFEVQASLAGRVTPAPVTWLYRAGMGVSYVIRYVIQLF